MGKQIPKTIAEKLDWLIANYANPQTGRKYTYKQLEEATKEFEESLTAAYIWGLHKGEKTNPSWVKLRSLAKVFKVPLSFFYEESLVEEDLQAMKVTSAILGNKTTQQIALYSAQLSEVDQDAVLTIIKRIAGTDNSGE